MYVVEKIVITNTSRCYIQLVHLSKTSDYTTIILAPIYSVHSGTLAKCDLPISCQVAQELSNNVRYQSKNSAIT